MSFALFAWIASIVYGLALIAGKLTSKYSVSNPWLFTFFYSFFVLLYTIPPSLVNNVSLPKSWDNLLLASFFSSVAFVLYGLALYKLDVSVLSPLFNFRTAFAVLFGIVFVAETLTRQQFIFIALIFIAGMFVSINEKLSIRSFFRLPIAIALFDMVALALMAVFIKKSIAQNGYWEVTLWSLVIGQVMLFTILPLFLKDLLRISKKQLLVLSLVAFIDVFGNLAAIKAYQTNVGISSAIISLPFGMIMIFILSRFLPRLLENHSLKVYAIRFIAAAVMFAAALKLTL